VSEKPTSRPAVFLDRDGTLNEVVLNQDGIEDSPFRIEDLALLPGAGEFTRRIRESGYLAVLVTNQPGVAKGSITIPELERLNQRLEDLLAKNHGGLDRIYYCPHHPVGKAGVASSFVQPCDCRKPAPGMLLKAGKDLDIDLSRSWMVGDKVLDVLAGKAAGCRTILMRRSVTAEPAIDLASQPTYIANNLMEALDHILKTRL